MSKTWSEQIDYLLKQGHRILKAERVGSGKKTKYYFTPVVAATTQNVAVITVVSLNFAAIVDLLLVIADQYSHRLFKTPIEVQMSSGSDYGEVINKGVRICDDEDGNAI